MKYFYGIYLVFLQFSELMLYGKAKVSNLHFLFLFCYCSFCCCFVYIWKYHTHVVMIICFCNFFSSFLFPFLPKFNLGLLNENNDLLEEKVQNKSRNLNIGYLLILTISLVCFIWFAYTPLMVSFLNNELPIPCFLEYTSPRFLLFCFPC